MTSSSPGVRIVQTKALGPICVVRTRNLNQALTLSNVHRELPVFTTTEINLMKDMDETSIKAIGMIKNIWRGAEVIKRGAVEDSPFAQIAPKLKTEVRKQGNLSF